MQQPYVGNGQFNQQQSYGTPPAPAANQQMNGAQQTGNQSNTLQASNQLNSQQPIVITQAGKKKKKTGQKVLNAIIVILAVALIVGIIALTIMQCKETKKDLDAQNAAKEAAAKEAAAKETTETITETQNEQIKSAEFVHHPKIVDNANPQLTLDSVNQQQQQTIR